MSERGISALEVVFALAATVTMSALALALTSSAIDEMRTATAARYVAGRIGSARIDAVRRATAVALRFEAVDGDDQYAAYEDGNGNGVRTAEIEYRHRPAARAVRAVERQVSRRPLRIDARDPRPRRRREYGCQWRPHRFGAAVDDERRWNGDVRDLVCARATRAVCGSVPGVTGRTRVLQDSAGNRTWLSR